MKFPPTYIKTPHIEKLLYELDVVKAGYALNPVSAEQEFSLRRLSLLKSSLFSARIEGNPLDISDVTDIEKNPKELHKIEVANLVYGYEHMTEILSPSVTIQSLKTLHSTVLAHISSDAGQLRYEDTAIFNQAGVAVYLPPAWQTIGSLLERLCMYINADPDPSPLKAAITHIWYEKIHPFVDGNGRVGRLLSAYTLSSSGYGFSGLVPFEQYLDEHRDSYYYFLGKDRQDVTEFVEFYLDALLKQATISLKATRETQKSDSYAHLLPRRAEIMRILEDHKIVTFDFLSRRFRAIPTRTLHNDLSQLSRAGLVQKMGSTRGVSYTIKK